MTIVQKKKVLLCSLSMMLGGVELRMEKEAKLLLKNGYDASIAINVHSDLKDWAQRCRRAGIKVFDFNPPPIYELFYWKNNQSKKTLEILSKLKISYKIWRLVSLKNKMLYRKNGNVIFKKNKPDLVHIFTPWSGFEGTRLWMAHRFNVPVVLSIRNAFFGNIPWNQCVVDEYRKIFRSVKGVYAISNGALTCFCNLYGDFIRPKTKLVVIHNSVDTEKYKNNESLRLKARNELGIPEDALVIGFVGRLEKQKRPGALLDLFKKLKEKYPTLYIVMVGKGSLEEKLRLTAKKNKINASVIFTGWKNNVREIIPAFDIGLSVSAVEGFGTSTIEIMACGIPVIATDVPGTHDILKDGKGGVLAPLKDENQIFYACYRLLEEKELRLNMGKEARKNVVDKFSEKIWNGKIIKFYEEIFS